MTEAVSRNQNMIALSEFSKLAIITTLVRDSPIALGRTGLMKCLFFLKILENVPLPYNFRLYTYGPFDSHVLEDLQYAESLGRLYPIQADTVIGSKLDRTQRILRGARPIPSANIERRSI
jgi:hypothetical protein